MSAPFAFDTVNPLEGPPFIIAYGEPKTGKSTEMMKALSNLLWVTSNPDVVRPFASWYRDNEEYARRMGIRDPRIPYDWDVPFDQQWGMARVTIPPYEADGSTPHNNWAHFCEVVTTYQYLRAAGMCPFRGIGVDEWTALADCIYRDMWLVANDPNNPGFKNAKGYTDTYAVPAAFNDLQAAVNSLHRARPGVPGLTTALICHPRPGDGTYKGGPKMPTRNVSIKACGEATAILRFVLERVDTNPRNTVPMPPQPQMQQQPPQMPQMQQQPPQMPQMPPGLPSIQPAVVPGTASATQPTAPSPPPMPALSGLGYSTLPPQEGEYVSEQGLVRRIITEATPEWEAGFRDFKVSPREKLDLRDLLRRAGVPM